MKKRGPKHTPGERELMKQVADEFTKKWRELGTAKKAADQLGVNPKSFYKYAHGDDLPGFEVLRSAQRKWKIKWKLIDTSSVFRSAKPQSAEQLLLPFIRSIREEDIEVIEVVTAADSSLQVKLRIQFTTETTPRSPRAVKK
jgi:hypothetical protein